MIDVVENYLKKIEHTLQTEKATELSYRSHLESLVKELGNQLLGKHIDAINDPKRIDCGKPDFIIMKGEIPLGYIETKKIGISLDSEEKSEQLARYLSLSNIILTDYLEFRWYTNGEHRLSIKLAEIASNKIRISHEGHDDFLEMIKLFLNANVPTVKSPKELAQRMAALARLMCSNIRRAFNAEDKDGNLHNQLTGLRKVLLHDLTEDDFSDMYAQTICYGLFAAWSSVSNNVQLTRAHAAYDLPKTNPFLQNMFLNIAGPQLDERVVRVVDDVVELLRRSDKDSILKYFKTPIYKEDPVVHFYETFLKMYNPLIRELRGVYYTPKPIVSYIVKSIDKLLKKEFALDKGLADYSKIELEKPYSKGQRDCHRVQILDPAIGTGAFLGEVINKIRDYFDGDEGMWSDYVRTHLLPRLHGFEILMVPYTIAHLRIGLLLKETGYDFVSDDRVRIYLTNTLEGILADSGKSGPSWVFDNWLIEEANAAMTAKEEIPVMVVVGNPPYANFGQFNRTEWILDKLEDYKTGLREKKLNLDDDFIKFIRFAQWRIERTGCGILAFVTNRIYIEGITHRRMRESLMETFSDIYILDLHGGSRQKEKNPHRAGAPDENVFEQIQQGVAISILVKKPGKKGLGNVHYAEMWGARESRENKVGKYERLLEEDIGTTDWKDLSNVDRKTCLGKFFFFTPKSFENVEEYCRGWNIRDLFLLGQSGIATDRDSLFFDFERKTLESRIKTFYSGAGIKPDFAEKYNVKSSSGYDIISRRLRTVFDSDNIQKCLYRPFDTRMLYYSPRLTSRPAWGVMQHLLNHDDNISLLVCRQQSNPGFRHVWCSRGLVQRDPVSITTRERTSCFPLYLYPPDSTTYHLSEHREYLLKWVKTSSRVQSGQVNASFETDEIMEAINGIFPEELPRIPNLHPIFIREVALQLGLSFALEGSSDLESSFGPDDIFHYAYSILHCPTYRERYANLLQIDFPHIQIPNNLYLFQSLCRLGKKLIELHLMDKSAPVFTKFRISGDHVVGDVAYSEPSQENIGGKVWINKTQYFENVPPEVWEFVVGSYQVCDRWLKDRRGTKLDQEDTDRYKVIVSAISETIDIMEKIDKVMSDHGGFPLQ